MTFFACCCYIQVINLEHMYTALVQLVSERVGGWCVVVMNLTEAGSSLISGSPRKGRARHITAKHFLEWKHSPLFRTGSGT